MYCPRDRRKANKMIHRPEPQFSGSETFSQGNLQTATVVREWAIHNGIVTRQRGQPNFTLVPVDKWNETDVNQWMSSLPLSQKYSGVKITGHRLLSLGLHDWGPLGVHTFGDKKLLISRLPRFGRTTLLKSQRAGAPFCLVVIAWRPFGLVLTTWPEWPPCK